MKIPAVTSVGCCCGRGRAERAGRPTRILRSSLLFPMLLSLVWVPANAEVRSITANPAEDCSTQMNIGWHANLDEVGCSVVYTERGDGVWAGATTVAGKSKRSDVFDGIDSKTPEGKDWKEEAKFLDYGVTLTGLKPDTDYMYKIEGGEGAVTKPVRYFKTAGAGEFSFLWFSDVHAYTPIPSRVKNLNSVIEEALKIEPGVDFMFTTGDVVAWGGSYSFWKYLLDQPFAANYMFADVIGNHDWMKRRDGGSSEFFAVAHNNPTNGYAGQEGVCYWFIYGDVLFMTFNNEVMKTSPETEAEAKAWAAGVIEKQKGKFKRIFIAEHYQWFDGRNGRSSWYDHWKAFCDEHHVTLAMSGNNHIYERTHPLRGDQVVAPGLGTVYMEAPSSDGERGVKAGPLTLNADKLVFTYSSQEHSNQTEVKTIGCVLVNVSPQSIRTRLVYLDEKKQVQVADDHTFATTTGEIAPKATSTAVTP
ncbi:metallophosphoesterase [Candidatus Sumerlaeota bacterium]|nr:metallophosphoesterase [Candidatus Sumerlaeota bacterium]